MLTIPPGVYRIRNIATNQYLIPQGGYATAGRQVVLEDFNQDGAQKWTVVYLPQMAGTYRIENFVNDVSLQPGIPATRRDLPALELNVSPFTWVIAQSATGQGYFLVKGDEQDQVAEADVTTGGPVLNDLDRSRSERRQMWVFEAV